MSTMTLFSTVLTVVHCGLQIDIFGREAHLGTDNGVVRFGWSYKFSQEQEFGRLSFQVTVGEA